MMQSLRRLPSSPLSAVFAQRYTWQVRSLSFTFAGPRSLAEIMQVDKLEGKNKEEIAVLWTAYHQDKENTGSAVLTGQQGNDMLSRGHDCQFFVQPVFRDQGHFMLVSQFQKPHFLLAYLEEYQRDPMTAKPIITASVFNELSSKQDIALVRCDYDEKLIPEGPRVVQQLLHCYLDQYDQVQNFNKTPEQFSLDELIASSKEKWNQ